MTRRKGLNKIALLILSFATLISLQTQDVSADTPEDHMNKSSHQGLEEHFYPEYPYSPFYSDSDIKPIARYTEEDKTLLILNGYYEVVGDPELFGPNNGHWGIKEGKEYIFRRAVAGVSWTVINRLNDSLNRWPKRVKKVFDQNHQFSWYRDSDPFRENDQEREPDYMMIIEEVVQDVLNGNFSDPTNEATYYQNRETSVGDFEELYNLKETVEIGSHTFYK